jgi:hypothetical protein
VNEVLVIVGVVVVVIALMALWVWVLGRMESRAVRRETERSGGGEPPDLGGAPRHLRRRRLDGRDPG